MKIYTKVFIACFIIAAAAIGAMLDLMLEDLKPRYREATEEPLVDTATLLSSLLAQSVENQEIDPSTLRSIIEDASKRVLSATIYSLPKTRVDLRVYVTDSRGIVIYDSEQGKDEGKDYSTWIDVHRTLAGQYGARTTRSDPEDPSTSVMYVASPVVVDGRLVGVVSVGKPVSNLNRFKQETERKIILQGLFFLAVCLLASGVVSALITRPILALTQYARAVGRGERVKLGHLGGKEVAELGGAFEEMREALEGRKYIERYVETLTHEIKSPLSAIKGAAELIDEEMPPEKRAHFLDNIHVEASRIQSIVERLLTLASLESRSELKNVESIDLAELAREAVSSLSPLAETKGVSLALSLPPSPVAVRGERFLLGHAFLNIMKNAVEFSPPKDRVDISVTTEGGDALLVVTDCGPGIPDYALAQVFDKFYSLPRPDTGKKSSGLGLSFAREVAELHGGRITLENMARGGVKAVFYLPR